MVRHIRNRHGGRLAIESMLGQEATFTAHMPWRLRRAKIDKCL